MPTKTSFFRPIILFAVYASLTSPAYAYLDPATGSIALQALIGAVATWVMYSKMFAAKVKGFIRREKGSRTPDPE